MRFVFVRLYYWLKIIQLTANPRHDDLSVHATTIFHQSPASLTSPVKVDAYLQSRHVVCTFPGSLFNPDAFRSNSLSQPGLNETGVEGRVVPHYRIYLTHIALFTCLVQPWLSTHTDPTDVLEDDVDSPVQI